MGARRELKWALEKFWSKRATEEDLLGTAKKLRKQHWDEQHQAGLSYVTSNDFSLYDHILDTSCMFGLISERFGWMGGNVPLDLYFSQARAALGYQVKPVIVGPVSLLSLAVPATSSDESDPLVRLHELLPYYEKLLNELSAAGADWVQIDEPVLNLKLSKLQSEGLIHAYEYLAEHAPGTRLLLASYFGECSHNANLALTLPVAGLHVDAVSSPDDALVFAKYLGAEKVLSVGVIDGRNVWVNDLNQSRKLVELVLEHITDEQLWLASSCSLQYVPHSLEHEESITAQVRPWLSFAREKLGELHVLAEAISSGEVDEALNKHQKRIAERVSVKGVVVEDVRNRVAKELPTLRLQRLPYEERRKIQQETFKLPLLPTTTIGSFPQTREVRVKRAEYKLGDVSELNYVLFIREEIRACIQKQEELGLDVLVHGEFERNDMVEYFASGLEGFCVTDFGWVQSYGSRCAKPPIIWGDVSRANPITLKWTEYAQSLTDKPVKAMLTGTTTLLQWSFVREDISRSEVSEQIALALRDEILDLEKAGVQIIQLDEAALREGLPLSESAREQYLEIAVKSFLISTSGVSAKTQIHTHMCYSEFKDILQAIIDLDADVISIEATRGRMTLLDHFDDRHHVNEIGPGVWDIHSARVPSVDEMVGLLELAMETIPLERLWANPDCGLKTRGWNETLAALSHLVRAAKIVRTRHGMPLCHEESDRH